jgi:hypothetical protein
MKSLDSIISKRILEERLDNGFYTVYIRRKHTINIIRNTFYMAMPIAIIEVNNGKKYFYIDNKKMELPPKIETIDGKEVVQKPIIMCWDKWNDAFLSLKSIDRVVNNRFKHRVSVVNRGIDAHTYRVLNRILRNGMDKYEFVFEELDDMIVNTIKNNPNKTMYELNNDKISYYAKKGRIIK